MLFSSITFLYYFLPIIILIYMLAPAKLKNMVLLLGSLFFYAWGEKKLVLMFMGTIFIGWGLGLLIEKYREEKIGKALFLLSLAIDLSMLGYFKYADFFIAGINRIFHGTIPYLHIALPIGISFYTFQILSYTIDVYRGKVKAQKNPISFAAYVSLFPQLIAGPIVRYADIERQLTKREHSLKGISYGVKRFILGLGKKVLIADSCGQLCAFFRVSEYLSVLYYWVYAISFMLQIYYDFSGYSDMAIGLGYLFGFQFPENFNYPYISKSITEFWRRWHMSLGSWFRDYVYIPLGGNKKGFTRQLCHILIVWMLTGLWHGASFNFLLWGLFYAFLLMIEKLGFLKWLNKHSACGWIYTVFMVMMGFVLFNAESMTQAMQDFAGLFGLLHLPMVSTEAVYYLRSYAVILLLGMIGATPFVRKPAKNIETYIGFLQPIYLTAILLIITAYLIDGSFHPFLYFRF